MPAWNTHLQVSVNGQAITPIATFTPTFNTPYTVIHSIEAANLGFVRGAPTFTFTMTIAANAPILAQLAQMALNGTLFDVTVAESTGTDWAFKSILFSNCIITQTLPSSINAPSGSAAPAAPQATFTCTALTVKLA